MYQTNIRAARDEFKCCKHAGKSVSKFHGQQS